MPPCHVASLLLRSMICSCLNQLLMCLAACSASWIIDSMSCRVGRSIRGQPFSANARPIDDTVEPQHRVYRDAESQFGRGGLSDWSNLLVMADLWPRLQDAPSIFTASSRGRRVLGGQPERNDRLLQLQAYFPSPTENRLHLWPQGCKSESKYFVRS